MAYPDFTQEKGSKRAIITGERTDRSENGIPRKRVLFAEDYYEFTVIHYINETDFNSLMDHYSQNRNSTFNFRWTMDGQDYLCEYAGPPSEDPECGGWRRVEVHLRSV